VLTGNRVRPAPARWASLSPSKARDAGIAGLEFMRGIPGTTGRCRADECGRLWARSGGRLIEATVVLRDGNGGDMAAERFGYTYRHSETPGRRGGGGGCSRAFPGDPQAIGAEMDRIAEEREASQPLRSRTGWGPRSKIPAGNKAWKLIDEAGCRGLQIGDAQVSEKHCNFLLNLGNASAAEIEAWARKCASACTNIRV
jgi:UDP-N-acetylmuramate dehydrogenase